MQMNDRRVSVVKSAFNAGAVVQILLRLLMTTLLLCSPLAADEDDDSYPGLVTRYSAGERTIERVDRDVQFVWGTHSPDLRIPVGRFAARWTGSLLIRTEGPHAFHLYMQGEATVLLNGKQVAGGRRDTPGWIEGEPVEVDFGEQKIEISYQQTAAPAILRLFWSSEHFPTEPIPPQLFYHNTARLDLDLIEQGRELFEAYRCQACHRREHDSPCESAPALTATSFKTAWLTDWLLAPQQQSRHARMPGFGFSRTDVKAMAAFFDHHLLPETDELAPPEIAENEQIRRQEILFRSIGCLACHTRGEEGSRTLHGGGDLTNVGRKRTAAWLFRWLKEPEKLNPDHRMPVFKLADDERRDLALLLAGSKRENERPPESGPIRDAVRHEELIATGKNLIATARCAACHRIEGFKPETLAISTLEHPVKDWSKACTQAAADRNNVQPTYTLAEDERRAIRAFVESRQGPLAPESPFARGQRLLQQKGCLNCHERDGGPGIATLAGAIARLDPELAGQSETLVPPNLTAVGDKLRDEPLTEAIAGTQKKTRLPWLRVRMPKFVHQPAEAAALVAFLIGHDRIPEGAPLGQHASKLADTKTDNTQQQTEFRKAGQTLAGTRGFSCTACHKIAGHEPRNVALATRGSDLYLVGDRMRPAFFNRWTRSPLRIVPGIEMPSFERPVAGILEGHLDRQLAALWEALNDRSAPPKIDTSTIEQVLMVALGEPPKIIRDVFALSDPVTPEFIARAFALGFDNRVNVLFDLDTMSIHSWWHGDFARQRSSGKSWFWEPAALKTTRSEASAIALMKTGNPPQPIIAPLHESGRVGRLLKYGQAATRGIGVPAADLRGIRLEYSLKFELPEKTVVLEVTELYSPKQAAEDPLARSIQREVHVTPILEGYQAVLLPEGLPPAAFHTDPKTQTASMSVSYGGQQTLPEAAPVAPVTSTAHVEAVTSVPGFDGARLPLQVSIMPTAITWTSDGTLAFCSLKGQVYLAHDTDGDGIEDKLTVFEEGLAAPYGLIADGKDLLVAHKPEILRLRDTDGDGRADVREVVADGWGYTADYHDWTTGIVRDSQGSLFVGTGSDYASPGRDREKSRWRGKVLRIDRKGNVTPVGHGFRYPTGLAITPDDQVFVSDNQGVQNTFNEINHLVVGANYGVPSLYEEPFAAAATLPAVQAPHPWTRSVNGIFFLPRPYLPASLSGHGIGCEYDNRFLVRFTLQPVGPTFQGAVYPFSVPTPANSREGFSGTLCGAVSPRGDIYIGSIHDSGWLGGTNVGDIVRLRSNGKLPVGIGEIRAASDRFRITLTAALDKTAAARVENYELSGITRKWQGTYATPDSNRHRLEVQSVEVAADGLSVVIRTSQPLEGYVYEINCGKIGPARQRVLWPATAHYTFNKAPTSAD